MAISRNRRAAPQQEEDNDWSITPMEFEPDPEPEPREDPNEKIKSLEQQLAELHQKLEDRESDRLLTNFAQPIQQEQFVPEKLLPLPDINTDPEGWAKATNENAIITARNTVRQQQFEAGKSNDLDAKAQELFDTFAEQYPEYAEMGTERVEFAATQVAKRAKARGLDVMRYMFTTRDRYLRDVQKEMAKTFGEPEEFNDDIDDDFEPAPRRRGRPARNDTRTQSRRRRNNDSSQDYDDGRTGGIFGGADSGGRPSGGNDEADRGSMIDDFQIMQRKTGFW